MTGSYFRGDTTPVMRPEDEEKFTRVSYTYYEQLNGYKHLKRRTCVDRIRRAASFSVLLTLRSGFLPNTRCDLFARS
jgi:hypothetical protein